MTAYQYTPAIWFPLLSAAFNLALSLYLWRRRELAGALPLAGAMLVVTIWCAADAGQIAAVPFETKKAWFLLADFLAMPGAALALWFALRYAGLERFLTRPVVIGLVGSVGLLAALYFVDDGRLLWSQLSWEGAIRGTGGTIGILFTIYGLGLMLLVMAVFLLLFIRSPAHRLPVALILVGQLGLRVSYTLELFSVVSVPSFPITVAAFDFLSAMYMLAFIRFRFFDLVPAARETIVERMPDAMLVIDNGGRIADLNASARELLRLDRKRPIGRPLQDAGIASLELARCLDGGDRPPAEVTLGDGDASRTWQVTTTPLSDWQGRSIGRLIQLHDISALRNLERQLVDRERALAAAQERERLARELHDGLAQDLWLAKLKATRLAAQAGLGAEARTLTEEVTAAVDAGIAEAREAVAAMRLIGQEGSSLRDLLSRTLNDFEDRFGLGVEFESDPDLPTLPARTEAEILRIAQEALTNVRRHADATLVRVRLALEGDDLVLEVKDNGRGFDVEAVGDSSYGLAGMRERAQLIGGRLAIASAASRGTRLRVVVPWDKHAAVASGR